MARHKKRRRGLGSSSREHVARAASALAAVRKNVRAGMRAEACGLALDWYALANAAFGSYLTNRYGTGARRSKRGSVARRWGIGRLRARVMALCRADAR